MRLSNTLIYPGTTNFKLLNDMCYLYVSGDDANFNGYGIITSKNNTAHIQEVKKNGYVTLSINNLDLTVECRTYSMAFSLTEL